MLLIMLQSMANNYGAFTAAVPPFLNVVDFAHRLVGPKPLEYISGAMNRVSNHMVPTWNPYMPRVSPVTQIRNRFRLCLYILKSGYGVMWPSASFSKCRPHF